MRKPKKIMDIIDFLQEHGDIITAEEVNAIYNILAPKIRLILLEKASEMRRK